MPPRFSLTLSLRSRSACRRAHDIDATETLDIGGHRRWFCGFVAILLTLLPNGATNAADLPGWDRTRWGMTSAEIAAAYGTEAIRLDGRIEFYRLYTDVALRRIPFAGHDFTVYFQMDDKTHRLAQVMLERRRQYATGQVWRDAVAALEHEFGPPTAACARRGRPLDGEPGSLERVWTLPSITVRASYIAFGAAIPDTAPADDGGLTRRLLIRYAPPGQAKPGCPTAVR